jgi:hypothetical protein
MKRALALVGVAGCSSILGLDNTHFEFKDAMVDAPAICDGAPPRCTSTTGRTVCGQVIGTGSGAGQPLRATAPTGAQCPATATLDGPCARAVFAAPMTDYFARNGANQVTGTLDDCGRFVVQDVPVAVTDLAIVLHSGPDAETATLALGLPGSAGTTTSLAMYSVTTATAMKWAVEAGGAGGPPIVGGYIVEYGGATLPTAIRVAGMPVGAPPTTPWGVYFAGAAAFGDVDLTLTTTAPNSSALVMPAHGSTFQLGAGRMGKTCNQDGLQQVDGVLIAITIPGC